MTYRMEKSNTKKTRRITLFFQVLAGQVKELVHVRFAMIRLIEPQSYPEFHNGQVPFKFLFVLVGPPSDDFDYHEVGRSLATLMANPVS